MELLKQICAKAKGSGRTIVLPEGQDPRVIKAANLAVQEGVANIIVLGTAAEISFSEAAAGMTLAAAIKVIDYTQGELLEELSTAFYEKRKAKGMTPEAARQALLEKRIYFGAMMLATDKADGLVAGSIASTGDMLRAAFQCVGTARGINLASSAFFMGLREPTLSGDDVLAFADCAVNPCPTAEQMVDIALSTARTYRTLVGKQPKVAFLSFSSKGSAKHELVDKVALAAKLTKEKFNELKFDAVVDGEIQADAALVPAVALQKNPGGAIKGDANVLIFPDLQSGNICYKLVQRLGGAAALGPVVQGVAKPINDLSRGCSAEDIFGNICITVGQTL
ncbi:MAG: phosphate acetyltransferase [Kiritimatiellia bacterium]